MVLFLTGLIKTQVTGQHRSLQVNNVFSTKIDIRPARWWERHPSIMLHNPLTIEKQNISSSAKPMTTKIGRVVAYDEGNSPMMSDYPLITWLREVTWQIKSLISPIPHNLWPPNIKGLWLMMTRTHPWCYLTFWPCGHVKSCDKLKF